MTDASAMVSRGTKSFARGIHPPHRKYTQGAPIELFAPTTDLVAPMADHMKSIQPPFSADISATVRKSRFLPSSRSIRCDMARYRLSAKCA